MKYFMQYFLLSISIVLLSACGGSSDSDKGSSDNGGVNNTIGGGLDHGNGDGTGGGTPPDTSGTPPDTGGNPPDTGTTPAFQLVTETGYKTAQKRVMWYKIEYEYKNKKLDKRLLYMGKNAILSSSTSYSHDSNGKLTQVSNINYDNGSELSRTKTTLKHTANKLSSGSTVHSYDLNSRHVVNNKRFTVLDWKGDIASKIKHEELDADNNPDPEYPASVEERTIVSGKVSQIKYGSILTTMSYNQANISDPHALIHEGYFKGDEFLLQTKVRKSTVEKWKFIYEYEVISKNSQGLPTAIKKTETYSNGKGRGDPDQVETDFITYEYKK